MIRQLTRKQFVDWLEKKMERDKTIWLLFIDLGFGFLERIQKRFPERVLNTGCIEQSAIGIGCGLALAKKKVFIYSTATFLLFRAFEQIRNDIAYQKLDVVLVGTIGKQYNFLGYTHKIQKNEDLAVLSVLPKVKYIQLL